ncbi:ATP-binding cassette domain-containing protein [Pseudomonas sp. Gutcm_11s]|uniref:ATP-binding cassette domain-containing protein n=1 Tax=Pseudomonas sp. Gutcm_11s TaxID=3026088 RepID=UPI002360F3A4|nr:ATP-binding cassette domain-containing protein [Pseudomonas sp. Gutcm_11s]MDD0843571.1 ATP-binding cassette domain-containing protein [Pseudomonas sp. Gutcm_11s]
MFRLDAVSFSLPERTLLHPLTLDIPQGQMVGLIGHNGSGKSTLLKMLARQQPASAGRVLLDDKAVADWKDRDFARQVAYLPQQLPSADSLTVRELVGFGRYPWHGLLGRFSAEDHAKVREAMELTDTLRFAERMVDSLSGGERQRVWLAMLLAQNSRYLLLDEPTSALDIAHQVDVLGLVHRLSQQLGLSVIVVLHDINMASRYCDRLIALHSGSLLLDGTPAELMTNSNLEAIYGLPMQVLSHPRGQQPIAVVV